MIFKDRQSAGKLLAPYLEEYRNVQNTLILGLPRGGVVVAAEVAKELNLPLDIICPRKIGAPYNRELAIGAITERGDLFLNKEIMVQLDVSHDFLSKAMAEEKERAKQQSMRFRMGRALLQIMGKNIILIDDGLATGATMSAAIHAMKEAQANKIVVAIPVAPRSTLESLRKKVDQLICLHSPALFMAVGEFYENFSQITDNEVVELLKADLFHTEL